MYATTEDCPVYGCSQKETENWRFYRSSFAILAKDNISS